MDFERPTVLGRTGLSVSRLGIRAANGVPARAIEKAYAERGVNTFYLGGFGKKPMEEALRGLCRRERERLVVVFQTFDRSGFFMKWAHERALKAIGSTYADILILGGVQREPYGDWVDRAARLKEEGKVRFLGLSSDKPYLLGEMVASTDSPFDVYLMPYNAVAPAVEEVVFPRLPRESPPGIITRTATAWGQLLQARRMPPGEEPPTAADCCRFALSSPNVDLCLMEPRNEREMEDGLSALKKGVLSREEMGRIRWVGGHVQGQ
ncbi:MAG: hypothetical protein JXR72_06825, partial [Proteobacteria bacterium]|nr:hypothetical protein [Pseudomonadota bacterium]